MENFYILESFYLGEAFHAVAAKLIEDNFLEPESDDYWIVPSIVNQAFACELYLKSILAKENPNWTKNDLQKIGHNLEELFHALSIERRDNIKSSAAFNGDTLFESKLHTCANCFNEWRYHFEGGHISVDLIFLDNFSAELHSAAEELIKK